jgi:DNA-binding YbaB/EbfC family protein
MKNIGELMLKAQKVQSQMSILQTKMEDMTFDGQSGNGLVKITLTGRGYATKVQLDDSVLNDKETLEDLIVVAISDAREKADNYMETEMEKMQNALGLPPGFKMPF